MSGEASRDGTQVKLLSGERLAVDAREPLDQRIGRVLDVQEQVISVRQLCACGLSGRAARGRVRSGRLVRLHRGVYALSARLPPLGPVAAALLACGAPAWACHRTGALVRNLRADGRRLVDVATHDRFTGRRHRYVRVHSGQRLRDQDVDVVNGLPVTSVARTLLDCAPVVKRRGSEKLIREAEHLGDIDLGAIRDLRRHVPGHPGWPILIAALGDTAQAIGETASPPEDLLLAAFRELGASGFECNPPVALEDGEYVYPDFLFRAVGLAVEVDPRGSHDRTSSYRSDRRRDRVTRRVADIETMRFSDTDMLDPQACAREALDRVAQLELRTAEVRKSRRAG